MLQWLVWQLLPEEWGLEAKTRDENVTDNMVEAAGSQEGSLPGLAREQGREAQGLTSVEHGAVAELRPVPAAAHQGVVRDHGRVVASPSPAAFGAPPPVRLWRDKRGCQPGPGAAGRVSPLGWGRAAAGPGQEPRGPEGPVSARGPDYCTQSLL